MKRTTLALLLLAGTLLAQRAAINIHFLGYDNMANRAITIEGEGFIPINTFTLLAPGVGFGFELAPDQWDFDTYTYHIPHQVTFNMGFNQSNNYLEIGYKGVESIVSQANGNNNMYSGFFHTGYRFHSDKSFVFKIHASPGFSTYLGSTSFMVYWGAGLGGYF